MQFKVMYNFNLSLTKGYNFQEIGACEILRIKKMISVEDLNIERVDSSLRPYDMESDKYVIPFEEAKNLSFFDHNNTVSIDVGIYPPFKVSDKFLYVDVVVTHQSYTDIINNVALVIKIDNKKIFEFWKDLNFPGKLTLPSVSEYEPFKGSYSYNGKRD